MSISRMDVKALVWGCSFLFIGMAGMPTHAAAEGWSGQYAGLSLGLSNSVADANTETQGTGAYFNAQDQDQVKGHTNRDFDSNALNGNIFWGYNKQSGSWVYGLEGALSLMNFDESYDVIDVAYNSTPAQRFDIHTSVTSYWNASLRPRLGYAKDNSLFFAAAGPALTKVKYDFSFLDRPTNNEYAQFSSDEYKLGWSVGAGYEYNFQEGWSLKTEFSYTDFGNAASGSSQLQNWADGFNYDVDYTIANLQIGVIKRF